MSDRLHALITDFTSGELSPRWQARVSGGTVATPQGTSASLADIYSSGCKEMTNMVPLPQGGAAFRLGTRHGAYTDDTFGDVVNNGINYRVSAFRFDGVTDLVFLWRPFELRVYNPSDMALLQTLVTPYADDDLPQLHFVQSQSEMVVLSAAYRPRIVQIAGFVFQLVDSVDRLVPPVFAFGGTLAPVAIEKSYTLTFSGTSGDPWWWFSISSQERGTDTLAVTQTADDAVTREQVLKAVRVNRGTIDATVEVVIDAPRVFTVTYEYWGPIGDGSGDLAVWPDSGGPSVNDVALVDNNLTGGAGVVAQSTAEPLWSGPFYVLASGNYYRCDVSHRSATDNAPGTGADWPLFWTDTGTTAPTGDIDLDTAWAQNTAYYPRGRGWPTLGTFHEQRLILNGPSQVPQALAAGRTTVREYLDFTLGTNADDGILLLIANESGLSIKWFLSQRKLFIGTSRGLYIQTEIPFTPTSVSLERHSMNRAARVDALAVNGEILYVQGNGRQVRKVQYTRDLDMWEGRDMTIFAEHLFRSTQPVRDWAYEDDVDSIAWVARDDGLLLSFTYSANYNVAAWAKHNIGAPVISMETAHAFTDELLVCIVQRSQFDEASQLLRVRPTLEVMEGSSHNMYSVEPEYDTGDVRGRHLTGPEWTVHLDAQEDVVGDGTDTITIPRLAGKRVTVVENGVVLTTVVAGADGTIQLDTNTLVGSRVTAGLPYPGRLVPNRIQFTTRDGTSQSQKVRWTKPELRLFASHLPLVNGTRARERKQADDYDTAPGLTSGDVSVVNLGTDTGLVIEVDQPLPCHITGVFGLLTSEPG